MFQKGCSRNTIITPCPVVAEKLGVSFSMGGYIRLQQWQADSRSAKAMLQLGRKSPVLRWLASPSFPAVPSPSLQRTSSFHLEFSNLPLLQVTRTGQLARFHLLIPPYRGSINKQEVNTKGKLSRDSHTETHPVGTPHHPLNNSQLGAVSKHVLGMDNSHSGGDRP